MMSHPFADMQFDLLHGAGNNIYNAWIALLKQANHENSEKIYMQFPIFPQFIILFENRLHLNEFLKTFIQTKPYILY